MEPQRVFAETVHDSLRRAARQYLLETAVADTREHTQTAQAMAIFYNVFDEAEKPAAFERLLRYIDQEDGGIDCGIIGIRVLFHVLSAFGRTDLAYHMITRSEFPSYAYWFKFDATSLFEDFHPNPSASRNHHFLGDIISWMMKNLVGITVNPFEENPNEVFLAPKFIDALDFAEGSVELPAGTVEAAWKRDESGDILYTFTLPVGVRGELRLEMSWQISDGCRARTLIGDGKPQTVRLMDAKRYSAEDDRSKLTR